MYLFPSWYLRDPSIDPELFWTVLCSHLLCFLTLKPLSGCTVGCWCVRVAQARGSQAWGQTPCRCSGSLREHRCSLELFLHSHIRMASYWGRDPWGNFPRKAISDPRCVLLIPSWMFISYQPRFYSLEMTFTKFTWGGTVTSGSEANFGKPKDNIQDFTWLKLCICFLEFPHALEKCFAIKNPWILYS